MDIQTIIIVAVGFLLVFLAVKKFRGGCCGGMKKEGAADKQEHGGGCCGGHKH
jgi:hypothetical protein